MFEVINMNHNTWNSNRLSIATANKDASNRAMFIPTHILGPTITMTKKNEIDIANQITFQKQQTNNNIKFY
eukprot:m.244678 g.244678  ORF g.244678 m.244678 type:complete len:71 (+) comp16106_c0_seq4:4904-5116(+)